MKSFRGKAAVVTGGGSAIGRVARARSCQSALPCSSALFAAR